MSAVAWLAAGLAVALALLLLGHFRDPLASRLGLRNALRHKRQKAVVVAGLLVGTAIIAAALVTGGSLERGIEDYAYSTLGTVDLLVNVEGGFYFPESTARLLAAPLPNGTDAASPVVATRASVIHDEEDLFEPEALVLAFDPEGERGFGRFTSADGRSLDGSELRAGEAYLSSNLAEAVGAEVGDTVVASYAPPLLPLLPDLAELEGRLVSATGTFVDNDTYRYDHSALDAYALSVDVEPGARGFLAVLLWGDASGSVDLDLELVAPGGETWIAAEPGPAAEPSAERLLPFPLPIDPPLPEEAPLAAGAPAFLYVRDEAAPGVWTVRAHAKAASDQPFRLLAGPLYPEYDLLKLREFYGDAGEAFANLSGDRSVGDPTEGFLAPANLTLTVAAVLAADDRSTLWRQPTLLLPLAEWQAATGSEGLVNLVRFSADGGVRGALASSPEAERDIEGRIAGARSTVRDPALDAMRVESIKSEWVEGAREGAATFTAFLTLLGSFSIIAGLLLIVNIFAMLAEERRQELGIGRAVGLTRARLVRSFVLEGSLYAALASFAGVVVGISLAGGLLWLLNNVWASQTDFRVPFYAPPAVLFASFAAGSLMTLLTVLLASWRASRVNIVRAIRGGEEPERRPGLRTLLGAGALLGIGALLTIGGIASDSFALVVLAPALLVLGAAMLLRYFLRARRVYLLAGLALLGYLVLTIFVGPEGEGANDEIVAAVRALLLIVAEVMVLVNTEWVSRALAGLLARFRRLAPLARVSLVYPLAKRLRAGLTMAMFAMVVLVIVIFSVGFSTFTPDVDRMSGGYDIEGETNLPVESLASVNPDPAVLEGVAFHEEVIHAEMWGEDLLRFDNETSDQNWAGFYGVDATFASRNGFGLRERLPAFADDEAAWRAVAEGDDLVIVAAWYVAEEHSPDIRHHPGARMTLNSTAGVRNFTVAAVLEDNFFGGIWTSREAVRTLFPELRSFLLFKLDPGVDAVAKAQALEKAYRDAGLDANSIEAEFKEQLRLARQVFSLFQLYLAMGIIVGVASVGIVTARAVLERRLEIGTMRALGFTRGMVFTSFLIETVFLVASGTLLGLGTGILVSYGVYVRRLAELGNAAFSIPWLDVALILLLTVGTTILATLGPIRRAARTHPAEALRYIE